MCNCTSEVRVFDAAPRNDEVTCEMPAMMSAVLRPLPQVTFRAPDDDRDEAGTDSARGRNP